MDSSDVEEILEFEGGIIDTDINYVCRICCRSDDNLVGIFQDDEFDEGFANKIMKYLPVKVSPDDVLPVKVCAPCTDMILKWHKFYLCCVNADKKFRAILSEEKLDEHLESPKKDTEDPNMQGSIITNSVNSEDVFDEMDVSSVVKDDLQIATDVSCQHFEQESGEDVRPSSTRISLCEHLEALCQRCGAEMENEVGTTLAHMKNCDNNCEICCKTCKWTIARLSKEFECEICNDKFPHKIVLQKHIYNHEKIFCHLCNKNFKSYTNLLAHKKLHQGSLSNFNCPICGMNMNRKYNLMIHINSHTADYPCKICCASFNSDLLLGHHKLTHPKEDIENYDVINCKVKCDNCEFLFNSRYELYTHTLSEHSNDREKFYCQCGRIFETEVMLKYHEKVHHSAVTFECNACNKKFKTWKGLEEHQNTHFNNRPFKCEECGKEFRYSSNLSQHRTMHKGVRNFICFYCGKKFLRSNTLAMHLKSHQNIRKYTCDFCSASFVQSSSLMKHKRTIHRSCQHCGEMVGDRKQWQIHIWKKCNIPQNVH